METQSQKRPGSGLILAGLIIAGLALLIIFLAVGGGGSVSTFLIVTILIGLLLAGIGFARRILFALERR